MDRAKRTTRRGRSTARWTGGSGPRVRHHAGVDTVPAIVVTGTVGAGKSSVAGEMQHLLGCQGIPHARVDVDALSECWPAPPDDPFNTRVMLKNLVCVWSTYRQAGAQRLVIAGVLERREDLEGYRRAVPGLQPVVCRLVASTATLRQRLRQRELGTGLAWHLRRAEELAAQLEATRLDDFVVHNEGRTLQETASEVLVRAGWLQQR
jgi:adenylylsulfate kinase